jgi:hypothetical protein
MEGTAHWTRPRLQHFWSRNAQRDMITEPRGLLEDETRDDKLIAIALNRDSASLPYRNRFTHAERWVLRNEVPPSEERERYVRAEDPSSNTA